MKPWARKTLIITTATAVCIIIAYTILLVYSGMKLKEARSNLEKSHRPMTADAIIPPAVDPTDNGALLYRSAVLLLGSESRIWTDLSKLAETGTTDEVTTFFQRDNVKAALRLIEQGASKPECRYDLDYSKGPNILLPHVANLRAVARLLAAKADTEIKRGDFNAAWQTVQTGIKTADALKTEPLLISQLVRIASLNISCPALQKLADVNPPPDPVAANLSDLLKSFRDMEPLIRSIDGERLLLGEWVFRMSPHEIMREFMVCADSHSAPDPGMRLIGGLLSLKGPSQLMHASYLNSMLTLTSAFEKPYWECDVDGVERALGKVPAYDIVSGLLIPAISAAKMKFTSSVALAAVTDTGLALIRHRLAHGSYPEKLDGCDKAFMISNPIDPFTGGQLVYRKEGQGFVLYSTGPNMKDDGGKPEPDQSARAKLSLPELSAKAWDIVWIHP